MSENFNGRLTLTVEMECFDVDTTFIEDNLRKLITSRLGSFGDIGQFSIHVEEYTS